MIELLAPAGNREKLEIAVAYGADAVYLGGGDYNLRGQSGNFASHELKAAVDFAHAHNVKVYLACNIYPRNHEIEGLADFLRQAAEIAPDALIIADAGVLALAREHAPQIPVHLSTQANTTSFASAAFWQGLGVSRVNVARELGLSEIAEMRAKLPTLELEAFVHGAMCISHSGRCLMSSFMANRDGNRGQCAHPCRWQYYLVEEQRPGQYHPVMEDKHGTYFFNSRDLCMLPYLDKMAQSGVSSLKIEGRMKTAHYLATVLRVYRRALDAYMADPHNYAVRQSWLDELAMVNTRGYTTGFYLGDEAALTPAYDNPKFAPDWLFAGKVLSAGTPGALWVEARNQLCLNDEVMVISPQHAEASYYTVKKIESVDKGSIQVLNGSQQACLELAGEKDSCEIAALSLLRKRMK